MTINDTALEVAEPQEVRSRLAEGIAHPVCVVEPGVWEPLRLGVVQAAMEETIVAAAGEVVTTTTSPVDLPPATIATPRIATAIVVVGVVRVADMVPGRHPLPAATLLPRALAATPLLVPHRMLLTAEPRGNTLTPPLVETTGVLITMAVAVPAPIVVPQGPPDQSRPPMTVTDHRLVVAAVVPVVFTIDRRTVEGILGPTAPRLVQAEPAAMTRARAMQGTPVPPTGVGRPTQGGSDLPPPAGVWGVIRPGGLHPPRVVSPPHREVPTTLVGERVEVPVLLGVPVGAPLITDLIGS